MHALFWNGRIEKDEEAPLPIQIFAQLFNHGMTIQKNIQRTIYGEVLDFSKDDDDKEKDKEKEELSPYYTTHNEYENTIESPYYTSFGDKHDNQPHFDIYAYELGGHKKKRKKHGYNNHHYDHHQQQHQHHNEDQSYSYVHEPYHYVFQNDITRNQDEFSPRQGLLGAMPQQGFQNFGQFGQGPPSLPTANDDLDIFQDIPTDDGNFQTVQAPQQPQPQADEKVIDTIEEVSFNKLFNFFANPEPSFRNLIMNTGFVSRKTISNSWCLYLTASLPFLDLVPAGAVDDPNLLLDWHSSTHPANFPIG